MLIFLPKADESADVPAETPAEDLVLLDPATLQLRRENARLQARLSDDEEWRDVTAARLFPRSSPQDWVSLQTEEGKELGVLEHLRGMSAEPKAMLLEELERRYLTPRIARILSRSRRFDVFSWKAQTDRGKVTFLTRGPPRPGAAAATGAVRHHRC